MYTHSTEDEFVSMPQKDFGLTLTGISRDETFFTNVKKMCL